MSLITYDKTHMKARKKQHISRDWDWHCRKITIYCSSYNVKLRAFIAAKEMSVKHQLTVVLIPVSANSHYCTPYIVTVLLIYSQIRALNNSNSSPAGY